MVSRFVELRRKVGSVYFALRTGDDRDEIKIRMVWGLSLGGESLFFGIFGCSTDCVIDCRIVFFCAIIFVWFFLVFLFFLWLIFLGIKQS